MAPDWFHPVIDVESRPFWDGCLEGRLMLKRCGSCKTNFYYPRAHCPHCWSSETDWFEASGQGMLYSFSIVHQYPVEPFASLLPYGNILVTLDEGPRMMANWDFSVSLELMECDMPVMVGFRRVTDELALPVFAPQGRVAT